MKSLDKKILKEKEKSTNNKRIKEKIKFLTKKKKELFNKTISTESLASILIPDGPKLYSEVIDVKNLFVSFDGKLVLKEVNINFKKNCVFGYQILKILKIQIIKMFFVGVIGPNGSGKTTLFRAIVKEIKPDEGTVNWGRGVKLGYLSQTRDNLDPDMETWEAICGGKNTVKLSPNLTFFITPFVEILCNKMTKK